MKVEASTVFVMKIMGESCFVTFSWLRQLFCRSSRRTNTWSSLAMATLPSGQLKPVSVDYLTSIRHPRPLQPGILRDLDRKSWGLVVRRYVLILVMDQVFLFGGEEFQGSTIKSLLWTKFMKISHPGWCEGSTEWKPSFHRFIHHDLNS